MHLRTETALLLSLPLSVMLGLAACGDDAPVAEEETAGSETATETGDGDGDGDPGDGDGDPGDGDGDPGDGDGDPQCPIGSEGCPCTGGGACDQGLMCDAGVCVPASGDGDGDGDGDPSGDGDGDGDGDTGNGACVGDEEIAIEAEDADTAYGWETVESTLGEDFVLAWDQNVPDAYAEWNIDVPCDGDWHIWVRAVNLGDDDSFFVQVDGGPMPVPIFEINCDPGPSQMEGAVYEWRELNLRDPMAPACEYVEDPWVQTWAAGPHTFTLGYRESYAISKLWLTTSDQPPP